jgi:actin-like ATPase involved in cell morphogenesis
MSHPTRSTIWPSRTFTSPTEHALAAERFRELLSAHFSATIVDSLVNILTTYVREEQAILRSATRLQATINTLLERTPPTRPLTVRDLELHFVMYGGPSGNFKYLFDTLEDELGIHVECTSDQISIYRKQ